ncbi:MAG: leucyl aminopeptidase [Janthinobacterium lividum]
MSDFVTIAFSSLAATAEAAPTDTLVAFVGGDMKPTAGVLEALGPAAATIEAAASVAKFKGKAKTALDLLLPPGIGYGRLLVVGTATKTPADGSAMVALGGFVMGKLREGSKITILFDLPGGEAGPQAAADFAQGLQLRAYRFDRYRTKTKDDEEQREPVVVTMAVADPGAVEQRAAAALAIADGVELARTLVNEPPNVLYPVEFARRAAELTRLGVEVEILDIPALERLKMGALLGVGQGSARESRVAVMRWNGAGDGATPLAFIGKGVTFDTGGISIKGAAGMEDMKGDMAGAACVVGLMHALAARKAKVDAVGVIGLVENMPDGAAQRPGDIVTSMSGQTIEIINTDAEGRLVLADLLWYVQDRFKPRFMVDLATLTGAILVALASEHAGLFSNDDELAERLHAAGKATGEKVWRLPLTASYDKLIDSKFADMKNTGGRHAGSITAAQFLQRFTGETPWVHLDIAGTGMGAPADDINQSWGSGWGVRLLDRLVADHYEA